MNKLDTYRELVKHENELTNHRLNWFILMQAMLFAGLGAMWSADYLPLLIVASLGLLICIPFGYVLHLNDAAISDLISLCKANTNLDEFEPPIIGYDKAKHVWLLPWNSVPIVFGVSWILVLALLIYRYHVAA